MSATKSIVLAIQVATSHRDKVSQNLVQIQRAHQFAENQMQQLVSYASDSGDRWIASAQRCAVPELMVHHYQFMDRLQHAIDLQREVIKGIEIQLLDAKKIMLEAEYRLSGLARIMDKRRIAEGVRNARREQRETDDLAAVMHRKNSVSEMFGGIP